MYTTIRNTFAASRRGITLALAAWAVFAYSQTSHGAVISWTVGDVDGGSGVADAAVSTNGTPIEAANFGGTDGLAIDVTVNTVLFSAANFTGGPYPLSNLTGLTFDEGLSGFGTSTGGDIDDLTDPIAFLSGTGVQNATLTGLIAGRKYEVQFFQSLNHVVRTVTIDDGNSNTAVLRTSAPNQFATGVFTATGATQSLTFTANTGSLILSGYQLRDITPAPEPSTMVLAVLGIAGLGFVRRGRRR